MENNVCGIHHCSLIVSDTKQSVAFYAEILGLSTDSSRPDLGYPGAWLFVGEQQMHLLEVTNPDSVHGRPEHGGRDHHVALSVRSLDAVRSALDNIDHNYTVSKSGRKALFFRDPDANAIEIVEV